MQTRQHYLWHSFLILAPVYDPGFPHAEQFYPLKLQFVHTRAETAIYDWKRECCMWLFDVFISLTAECGTHRLSSNEWVYTLHFFCTADGIDDEISGHGHQLIKFKEQLQDVPESVPFIGRGCSRVAGSTGHLRCFCVHIAIRIIWAQLCRTSNVISIPTITSYDWERLKNQFELHFSYIQGAILKKKYISVFECTS